jgi:hypothetical protein
LSKPKFPAPLKVPAGNKLTSSLDGAGVQIYQCANGAWTLLQPAATPSDHGKPVGLHFKGPIWMSTVDGSEVGAAPVATVQLDGAVPYLLLKANHNQGRIRQGDLRAAAADPRRSGAVRIVHRQGVEGRRVLGAVPLLVRCRMTVSRCVGWGEQN